MKTQIEKLKEKINEAINSIETEKNNTSFVFCRALQSVLVTIEEIEQEEEFKIGDYYYFYDDFKEPDGFIYGKLVEISTGQEVLPYCVQLPNGTHKFWYSAINKELPIHLLNPLNN